MLTVVLSPFERTQQTLCALMETFGEHAVREVHVDPRVREQEFGNLQSQEDLQTAREEAQKVGRFYYRRPNGESSADVYDRASDLWESPARYSIRTRFEGAAKGAISGGDDSVLLVDARADDAAAAHALFSGASTRSTRRTIQPIVTRGC